MATKAAVAPIQTGGATNEQIWVKSNRDDNRVVLHEWDDAHPSGEVYIAGELPVKAARTFEIERRLESKQLVELSEADARAILDEYENDRLRREEEELRRQFPGIDAYLKRHDLSIADAVKGKD